MYSLQYGRAVWITPLYDDWALISDANRCMTGVSLFRGLLNFFETPLFTMWRPLHVMHFALADGESLVWVQIVKLAFILICGICLVWSARAIGLSRGASFVAGAVFFLHQNQVLGGEPDIMGDVIVTLSVILVVGLSGMHENGKIQMHAYATVTGILTAFACLGKEAGVMIPFIPLTAWIVSDRRGVPERSGHMYAVAASLVVLAAYLSIRTFALDLPLSNSNSDWSFHFGGNILYNLALISGALVCPVSTIQLFLHNLPLTIFAIVFLTITLGLLAYGVLKLHNNGSTKRVLWLVVLFMLVQGPVLLFDHTNERNLSRSLPLGILACAFLVSALWRYSRPGMKLALVSLFGIWIVFSQIATNEKVDGILRMHTRGKDFLDQVQRLMPEPLDRQVLFACEAGPKGYSEYDQPFWLFMPGTSDQGLQYRYRSPDFRSDFVVVDSPAEAPEADFWVTVDGRVTNAQ